MGERESERKTSLGFNDISNIHADAFCCFVLSFSTAPHGQSLELATHAPARQSRGQRGRTRKEISGGGIKEEKNNPPNKREGQHKAFLLGNKRSNLPYPGG